MAVALSMLAAVVVALVLWALMAPRFVVFGGGDEENYLANGYRQAYRYTQADEAEPAYQFLPPEWREADAATRDEIQEAFLDAEGRMFRLRELPPDAADGDPPQLDPKITRKKAVVTADDRIEIAHDNLFAGLLSGAVIVESRWLPFLVNYALAGAIAVLFAWFLRGLNLASLKPESRAGGWGSWLLPGAGGLLLVTLPSMAQATRIPRTEHLALALLLAFVVATQRTEGRAAWPGLFLVLLWMTRHEAVVMVILYLGWAALRRRRDGWAVVAATVAAAYLFPWGPASAGDLFPGGRDVFSVVPGVGAWALIPAYWIVDLVGRRRRSDLDRMATAVGELGARVSIHRAGWSALVLGAVIAELIRRGLDPGEKLLVLLRGQRLSTFSVLFESVGWPLVVVGVVGLVAFGWRLAGRLPFVAALVIVPQAFVLVRMGASGADLFAWSRRLHIVIYPVLVLGLVLTVDAFLRAARERQVAPALRGAVAVGAVAVVVVGTLAGHEQRPDDIHPTRADVDGFAAGADRLDPASVVVLGPRFASMKSQLPLRVHHGHYSFVVWDPEAAAASLGALWRTTDRTVYVEDDALDVADAAGLMPAGDPVTLAARYNDGPGRDIELVPVTPAPPGA